MKATWGETSDKKSEGEDGENDNLALMAKSDTNTDSDSTENQSGNLRGGGLPCGRCGHVSAPTLNEGIVLETESLNVLSEPGQELENSRGIIPEIVVTSAEGTEERTSLDSVLEKQNDSPQELNLMP
ncbi:hypothetical protein HAX54_021874 [Datura stramonium]|uniref:Uncharacterized protein n=1 Tax=Datura stramonium TaxID=4076 RepID=A0ABS8UVI1_DATST|nr:hypothetical protein [Datura stramonium]